MSKTSYIGDINGQFLPRGPINLDNFITRTVTDLIVLKVFGMNGDVLTILFSILIFSLLNNAFLAHFLSFNF